MAKYTIRQYRQKLKTFEKRLSEYVSYEGRIYNQKYNEFQERIERMERMIKNRTYTQLELNNMMRSLDRARVTDYVVQYDPTKDKFVSPVYTPVFNKRKDKTVPSIHEAKREATEAFNKWLPEEQEDVSRKRKSQQTKEEQREPQPEPPLDYDGALFIEILLYLEKKMPTGIFKELHDAMLKIANYPDKIRQFEALCSRRGVDVVPVNYDLAIEQLSIMDIILGGTAGSRDISNEVYDDTEFTS